MTRRQVSTGEALVVLSIVSAYTAVLWPERDASSRPRTVHDTFEGALQEARRTGRPIFVEFPAFTG
jgi:hypothetical protein